MFDLNNVATPSSVIPEGTVLKVSLAVQRPDMPAADVADPNIRVSQNGAQFVNYEVKVLASVDGKYVGSRFFTTMLLKSSDESIAKNIAELKAKGWQPNPRSTVPADKQLQDAANKAFGMQTIKSIVLAQNGLTLRDTSDAAKAALRINGFADLNEKPFLISVGIREDQNGTKRNDIKFVIMKDSTKYKDAYNTLMGGATSTMSAAPAFTAPAGSTTPSWM